MVSYELTLEWCKINFGVLIIVGVFLFVILLIIIKKRRKRNKREREDISLKIYERRKELRELDNLLKDLEEYFIKIEKNILKRK